MSALRLILASLVYHARRNLAVALGVAAATAVLTGALLVGDAMRGSLRRLILDRLGRIDDALVGPQFFRTRAIEELAARPEFQQHFSAAVPAIILQGSVESDDARRPLRANHVQVIGCGPAFWELAAGSGTPPATFSPPGPRQIVLNRPLAEQLGVQVGDAVLVRLPVRGTIPADTALGRKRDTVEAQRVTVGAIIPAEGLGRFGLQPTQQLPRNAYLPLAWLQQRLDRPDRANAALVAGRDARAPSPAADAVLQRLWQPRLADCGLRLERTERGYFNLTSERMLLDPAIEKVLLADLQGEVVQPALTYLANAIACGERQIPYSTITAVDFRSEPPLGPMLTPQGTPIGPLTDGQIVLNRWAADDLRARPGDTIRVSYFEPETTGGQARERTVEFRLAAVAEMAGAAADRSFTPDVPGVTDQRSMSDWDAPFPFDARRIRPQDDRYWQQYHGTPKALVSLAAGRRLWANRFGQTTSLRIAPRAGMTLESLDQRLAIPPEAVGLAFQDVKQQGLAAAVGTTPFSVLFLAFSSFIIAAAVMLVALLFCLGIDARAGEIGTLLALGLGRRQVGRLLAAEGLLVTAAGSLLGLVGGVGYAALMLAGLRTWWLGAVVTPFLRLYVTPGSLLIGYASGVLVAFAAIAWSVRRTARVAPRRLLAGGATGTTDSLASLARRSPRHTWIEAGLILLVLGMVVGLLLVRIDQEEVRAAAFFGEGTLTLVIVLVLAWMHLRAGRTGPTVTLGRGNLVRMALRNAARNPGRSTLTLGLVGSATFIIAAVSAFRLDPAAQEPRRESGNGGFALVAESDQPIYHDLNTPEGHRELGFPASDDPLLSRCQMIALRARPGEDASCLNLYQPRRPRVLGVPEALLRRGGFVFSGTAAVTLEEKADPWLLLDRALGRDADGVDRVPVVLEKNTAEYSLHLRQGVGATYELADGQGGTIRLEVVGLLANSIFQGELLIGEKAFLRLFPDTSGYRFFLIEAPRGETSAVRAALERTLGDYGFAAESTGDRLAGFLAVQNTYLSTFQSLGSLGLLLGTFGLAAVQLRNVLERRGELALLRATGFRRRSLAGMVMLENSLLLLAGLGTGAAAALVAVLPFLVFGGAAMPWASLAWTLLAVLAVGLSAGLAAVRAALAAPVLGALRSE